MKDRIKKLRKSLDMTQQEFADKIGVKRNTIGQYEIGRNEPIDAVVNLICREFNVNEEWLRTGNGEMFRLKPLDVMEKLKAEYNLSDIAAAMIKCFIDLKPEVQNEMFNFFRKVVHLASEKPESEIKDEHQLDETTKYALELFQKNFLHKNGDELTTEELESEYKKRISNSVQNVESTALNTTNVTEKVSSE